MEFLLELFRLCVLSFTITYGAWYVGNVVGYIFDEVRDIINGKKKIEQLDG